MTEVSHRHFEARFLEMRQALVQGAVKVGLHPLFGPGGDGPVDGQDIGAGRNNVQVQHPGGVAGPDDGARVMGDGDSFEDHTKVRLAAEEDAADLSILSGVGMARI